MSNEMQYENEQQLTRYDGEIGQASAIAKATTEIQSVIAVAKRFPRNEDEARVKLLRACKRPNFADEAEYEFPRGGNDISGPSVNLAREAKRLWGNIRSGFDVIREDEEWRVIECWAWDVETNTYQRSQDCFKKLVYRKKGGWVTPDERDLRELTNRRAATGERNCILQLLPKDLIEEALMESRNTLKNRAAQDPDGERKRIADAFASINVMPAQLDVMLGHPLAQSTPAEIAKLRGIYTSLRAGNSNLSEYMPSKDPLPTELKPTRDINDPKNQPPVQHSSASGVAATAGEPNSQGPREPVSDHLEQAKREQKKLDQRLAQEAEPSVKRAEARQTDLEPATETLKAMPETKGIPMNFK